MNRFAAIAVAAPTVAMAFGIGIAYAIPSPDDYSVRCADVPRCWTVEVDGQSVDLPECAYEDGNVNGMPCLWVDPGTGQQFYVSSENYR